MRGYGKCQHFEKKYYFPFINSNLHLESLLLEAKQDQYRFLCFHIFIVKSYLHDIEQIIYTVRLLGQGLSYTTANIMNK